jgi:hypothetical protein
MINQETLGAMAPDLSCDLFLWGYLKCRVYTHKPRNLNELKDAIRQEVLTIDGRF